MDAASPADESSREILDRLVTLFNSCARSGNFSACESLFADDAVLEFEGVPEWGPYVGKAAVLARLSADPPDDEVRVVRWKTAAGRIRAQFMWRDLPEARGGAFVIEPRDGRIARLTIALGGPSARI